MDLDSYRRTWQPRIDVALDALLGGLSSQDGCPRRLGQAMRHAVLTGGKRLRPLMCLATIRAVLGDEEEGLAAACALELVHAYSLAHDDLPAMDDDAVRRGQPTCHVAFGEAAAILAGDALLTHAFGVLADAVPAEVLAPAVRLLVTGAGSAGMVGGQADDVELIDRTPTVEEVEAIHRRKTAAMFVASVGLGAVLGGGDEPQRQALGNYALALGLAFQIVDDLLAWRGDEDVLGRPAGSDRTRGRRVVPAVVGEEGARTRVRELLAEAESSLAGFGERADVLQDLVEFVRKRAG